MSSRFAWLVRDAGSLATLAAASGVPRRRRARARQSAIRTRCASPRPATRSSGTGRPRAAPSATATPKRSSTRPLARCGRASSTTRTTRTSCRAGSRCRASSATCPTGRPTCTSRLRCCTRWCCSGTSRGSRPTRPALRASRSLEGRMVPGKGNVEDMDVVWTMHALDDGLDRPQARPPAQARAARAAVRHRRRAPRLGAVCGRHDPRPRAGDEQRRALAGELTARRHAA